MSNYILINGELYHHGIKGQRWGIRRYQNKDGSLTPAGKKRQREEVKQERKRLEKAEYDRLTKEYNISGKRDAAIAYGRKHNLDLDDGGGGSRKAGKKYLDMWGEIEQLDSKALANAKTYARKELNRKFGEQTIKSIEERDAKIATGKAVIAASTLMLVPAATVIGLIATDPNLRK